MTAHSASPDLREALEHLMMATAPYAPRLRDELDAARAEAEAALQASPAPEGPRNDLAEGVRRVKEMERRGYNPPYAGLVMNDPDAGL